MSHLPISDGDYVACAGFELLRVGRVVNVAPISLRVDFGEKNDRALDDVIYPSLVFAVAKPLFWQQYQTQGGEWKVGLKWRLVWAKDGKNTSSDAWVTVDAGPLDSEVDFPFVPEAMAPLLAVIIEYMSQVQYTLW